MGAPPMLPMEGEGHALTSQPTAPTPPATTTAGLLTVEQQRAIAETQAAMFVAKQFPRELGDVLRRIERACGRPSLAEIAAFSFPRGGEEVTGPSVYLLKAIAQEWGNITYGVRELSRSHGTSQVQAFAWDMERNVREERNFEVKHWRDTKKGGYALKDERDIYELIANMGARRLRACLEGVIPEDVKQYAIDCCDRTLVEQKVDTPEARAKLLGEYERLGVTRDRIEARLGKSYDAATKNQMMKLMRGLNALRDGVTTPDEAFPPLGEAAEPMPPAQRAGTAGLKARVAASGEPSA